MARGTSPARSTGNQTDTDETKNIADGTETNRPSTSEETARRQDTPPQADPQDTVPQTADGEGGSAGMEQPDADAAKDASGTSAPGYSALRGESVTGEVV